MRILLFYSKSGILFKKVENTNSHTDTDDNEETDDNIVYQYIMLIVLTVRFFIMYISAINNKVKKLNLNFKIIVPVKRI